MSLEDLAATSSALPPPFFIWHTQTDDIVPLENSLVLARALSARGGAVETHLFAGPAPLIRHGLDLAANLAPHAVSNWTGLCAAWMAQLSIKTCPSQLCHNDLRGGAPSTTVHTWAESIAIHK